MEKAGVFIAIEGREGVGKSTLKKALQEMLPVTIPSRQFVFTREPGGTPYADKIYDLFKQGMSETNARALFGLVLASRFDHIEKVVKPELATGKVVVSDRYEASTFAYQVFAQQAPELEPMYFCHRELIPHPDMTLILEAPTDVILARLAERKGQEVSAFDASDRAFHDRLAQGYERYARDFVPDNHCFVNGNQAPSKVQMDALDILFDCIPV